MAAIKDDFEIFLEQCKPKRELIHHFKAIQNLTLTQVWCVIEKCRLITQYICLSNAKELKILIAFFLFYFVLF